MADPGREPLFKSYKISVANESAASKQKEDGELEESSDTDESDSSGSDSTSSSESEEEGELSDEDVEVSVVVGTEDEIEALDKTKKNNPLPIPAFRRNFYNKDSTSGRFGGGRSNVFDEPDDVDFGDDFEQVIRDDQINENVDPIAKKELFKSLDLTDGDFIRGGWRSEAICMKGIERFTPKDVFDYFDGYSPESIEWINENTCNVLWPNKFGPVKALFEKSCEIKPPPKHAPKQKEPRLAENSTSRKEIESRRMNGASISGKREKGKKSKDSNESSSDSSSESDSDESEDSSSSGSSSSSDSSSSSESSDDSSDSDDETEKKGRKREKEKSVEPMEDTVALPPNFNAPKPTSFSSDNGKKSLISVGADESMEMEVDDDGGPRSTLWSEVSVPIPSGRWRLGMPHRKSKGILMRFAHCKEKKDPAMMERPLITYNEVFGIDTRRPLSDRVSRIIPHSPIKNQVQDKFQPPKRIQQGHNRFVPAEFRLFPDLEEPYKDQRGNVDRPPSSRGERGMRGRIGVDRGVPRPRGGYEDLDNPFDDNKNPWGFLAQNWSNKVTQETLDYNSLLNEHVTGEKKRKRAPVNSDLDSDGTEYSRRNGHRQRSTKKVRRNRDEESDDGSGSDNSIEWKSKIKLPRMKMYADSEEKKKKKSVKRSSLRSRIGLDEERWSGSENVLRNRNGPMFNPALRQQVDRRERRAPIKPRRSFGEKQSIRSRLKDTRKVMR